MLPGALAAPDEVLAAGPSPDLAIALTLVCETARRHGVDVRCLARPEMFTHGTATRWLAERTHGATQHLCLSDGSTVKLLAGCRTHVFFHRAATRTGSAALRRLARRAPELLAGLAGQVNTHFAFGPAGERQPVPLALMPGARQAASSPAGLLSFVCNRYSAEDSANRIAAAGPVAPVAPEGGRALHYIPLTDAALDDRCFARDVARAILRACFDPEMLLVLRLPPAEAAGPDALARRIAVLLPALRGCGTILPAAAPGNVLFATDDLDEAHPLLGALPLHILVHESFDFWRHPPAFYARAARVTVLAADTADDIPGLPVARLPLPDVAAIYGHAAIRLLPSPRD